MNASFFKPNADALTGELIQSAPAPAAEPSPDGEYRPLSAADVAELTRPLVSITVYRQLTCNPNYHKPQ